MTDAQLLSLYLESFDDTAQYAKLFIGSIAKQNKILHCENGKVVSAGYIVPKIMQFNNKSINAAYLSALSTLKEQRGKNKISIVIGLALNRLYERGVVVTLLNPFDFKFYKRFDFCNVSFVSKREFTKQNIFTSKSITLSDIGTMQDIELKMAKNFNSFLVSDYDSAASRIAEYAVDGIIGNILYFDNKPFAYCFCEDGKLDYCAYEDADLFFSGTPSCVAEGLNFFGSDMPFVQGRIVNALQMLKMCDYSFAPNMIKTFEITDNIIVQNNIKVSISIANGQAEINLCDSADTKIEIMQLTDYVFNGGLEIFKKQKNLYKDKY